MYLMSSTSCILSCPPVRVRYHRAVFREWQIKNQVVRMFLLPRPSRSHSSTLTSPSAVDLNNNHLLGSPARPSDSGHRVFSRAGGVSLYVCRVCSRAYPNVPIPAAGTYNSSDIYARVEFVMFIIAPIVP